MGVFAIGFWILVLYFLSQIGVLTPEVMQEGVVPFIGWGLFMIGAFVSFAQIKEWHENFEDKLRSREHAKYLESQPESMMGFTKEWRRKQRSGWQTFWYWAFFVDFH